MNRLLQAFLASYSQNNQIGFCKKSRVKNWLARAVFKIYGLNKAF